MMSTAKKVGLRALVERIEAELEFYHPSEIINDLVNHDDARYRRDQDPERLSLGGVTSTCTAGPHGLLTNWCAAARRKIGEAAL